MSVTMENICVSFAGVKVLKNISMSIKDGEICGILGANGSGKSTLIKVLSGVYHPDRECGAKMQIGRQLVDDISDTTIAYNMGIRTVHQESPLIDEFTVAECIAAFKGYPGSKKGKINWNRVAAYAEQLLETYQISLPVETYVKDLSAAQRNMLAIAIAIGEEEELKGTTLLILDESEASIPENEAESFLERVRFVAQRGIPVIMISHRLKSVLKYCDKVAILNDGELVFEGQTEDINEEIIVNQMLKKGKSSEAAEDGKQQSLQHLWETLNCKTTYHPGQKVLEVRNLQYKKLQDCSFEVYAGDILGIVGGDDGGIHEIPWLITGVAKRKKGEIYLDGKKISRHSSIRERIKSGIALLPCDRPKYGGIMECSMEENILLPNRKKYWNHRKLKSTVLHMMQNIFDIQPGDSFFKNFSKFSGGNQQKAIMAKWMSMKPRLFILDDPTYGVDPNSRKRLFQLIQEGAKEGMGVIIFSTEPEQLAEICTRVIVVCQGRVTGEIRKEDGILEREMIARWSYL